MSRNRKSDDWSRLGFPSGCSPPAWEIRLAAKGLVTESTCYICQGGERWLAEAIDRRTVRLRQKGYLQYGTPSLRRYHAVMHMGVLPYNHEVHHLPDEHGFTDRFRDWDWRRLMVLPQGEHRKLASIYPSRWADSYTGKTGLGSKPPCSYDKRGGAFSRERGVPSAWGQVRNGVVILGPRERIRCLD